MAPNVVDLSPLKKESVNWIHMRVSMASCLRQRKQKRCRKCNQELSHSAYARHLNPTVCPEVQSSDVEEQAAENLSENALSHDALQQGNIGDDEAIVDVCESDVRFDSNSPCSVSEESQEHILSGSEEMDTSSASDHEDDEAAASHEQPVEGMKAIAIQICMFQSFFQLCYRVSDRAISLLLSFLKTLLSWLGSYCPEVKTLHDVNIYFMRKLLGRKNEITCLLCVQNAIHFIVSKIV